MFPCWFHTRLYRVSPILTSPDHKGWGKYQTQQRTQKAPGIAQAQACTLATQESIRLMTYWFLVGNKKSLHDPYILYSHIPSTQAPNLQSYSHVPYKPPVRLTEENHPENSADCDSNILHQRFSRHRGPQYILESLEILIWEPLKLDPTFWRKHPVSRSHHKILNHRGERGTPWHTKTLLQVLFLSLLLLLLLLLLLFLFRLLILFYYYYCHYCCYYYYYYHYYHYYYYYYYSVQSGCMPRPSEKRVKMTSLSSHHAGQVKDFRREEAGMPFVFMS